MQEQAEQTVKFLRREEVERLTTLSRSTIYALMGSGEFPRPFSTGRRSVAWRADEIAEWIATRPRVESGRFD